MSNTDLIDFDYGENPDFSFNESPPTLSLARRPASPPRLRLPLLDLPIPETDTLIYLCPISAPSPPLRCCSQKLLAADSPFFTKLLGPTYQFRLLRRKNLLKIGLPVGIKYVLDLSPPSEGDDAVEMVEKLWCSNDVLSWKSKITDGYVEPDEDPEDAFGVADTTGGQSHWEDGWLHGFPKPFQKYLSPPPPSTAPYSATRHTAAIERVLHILHGLDPRVHTTSMWYTVHKVSVEFQCTSIVQDYTLSWLYGNIEFIERSPGLVLQIAAELQNPDLFRDAFALLVGRQLIGGFTNTSGLFEAAVPQDKLPEEAEPWRKNIAFARRSLQERVERMYSDSLSGRVTGGPNTSEYARIASYIDDPTTPPYLRNLAKNLLQEIGSCLNGPENEWRSHYEIISFDLIPEYLRHYSRAYWRKLEDITKASLTVGPEGSLDRKWGIALEYAELLEMGMEEEWMRRSMVAAQFSKKEPGNEYSGTIFEPQRIMELREWEWRESLKGKGKNTTENPAPEIVLPLRVKRKSFDEGAGCTPSSSTVWEDMTTACILPRGDRIEISNPISKRRCSTEGFFSEEDEAESEMYAGDADLETDGEGAQTGEPEMFGISDIYEDILVGDIGHPFMVSNALYPDEVYCNAAYWNTLNPKTRQLGHDDDGKAAGVGAAEGRLIATRPPSQRETGESSSTKQDQSPLNNKSTSSASHASPIHSYSSASTLDIYQAPFDLRAIWNDCLQHFKEVSTRLLKVPISFPPALAGAGQVLVCLEEEEWRFVPIWAGGLDDGSGGVFGEGVVDSLLSDKGVDGGSGSGEVEGHGQEDEGEATEVESLIGSYDDCFDTESIGSFETGGFSEFDNSESESQRVWSEFGDSEADEGLSDVEVREESEVESIGESTEGETEFDSDEFEEVGWESV